MEKYIGLVKWFHDSVKNANYGFIQHAILGDLFFHERSIEQGQNINAFVEDEVVVFVSQASKKYDGKLEAIQVKLLSTEDDINFLFNHFLSILTERGKYSDYNQIQKEVHSRIHKLLKATTDSKTSDTLFKTYSAFVSVKLDTDIKLNTSFLKGLFNVCKYFFPSNYDEISRTIETKVSSEIAHTLWLEKYLGTCQIDYISNFILSADKNTQGNIFNLCSEDDKANIFFRVIYLFENIDNDFKLETIKNFLKLSQEFASNQHDKILKEAIRICPPYYKLMLWLEDIHEELNFEEYKMFTIVLKPSDQRKFVKKTLKYIHEEKATISIDALTSINIIDYETSKLSEEIDNSKLDYSTSIILNVISELNKKTNIETRTDVNAAKNKIFDLIISQIKKPDDILEITGYFDQCEGRCSASIIEEKNDKGEVIDSHIDYNRNEHNKPKLHSICDGRKAINKANNKAALSEENGLEFWWCGNQKCYKPSRQTHKSEEWEKYSLFDFLTILKSDFKEKDFELYLNLINKANRFLKHLKCRSCNHILRPIKQSNYAFYGVNDFHCTNESCDEKNKRIYLTHCLNGQCEQAIDSRDSVRCRPEGVDAEKCGWYVCNYCHSCCSDEGISRRVYIIERTGQEYKCHKKGHRNLGILSCNKCGFAMESNVHDESEYQKVLNWFIRNKDNQELFAKSGQVESGKRAGKWWFRFKKNNLSHDEYYQKLGNLIKLGFRVPNFEEYERTIQLVSEGDSNENKNSDILICSNPSCENILDLTTDLERTWAIKKFHNVRFVRQMTENN